MKGHAIKNDPAIWRNCRQIGWVDSHPLCLRACCVVLTHEPGGFRLGARRLLRSRELHPESMKRRSATSTGNKVARVGQESTVLVAAGF
jgi:hypothetical protein